MPCASFAINAVETASRFGISADRAQNCHADNEGVELNFRVMSEAVANFREGDPINTFAIFRRFSLLPPNSGLQYYIDDVILSVRNSYEQ